jgi:transposase InsO family protein
MAHSQARELVEQGYTATLVSNTLKISRSSLYYRKRPQRDRSDRRYDEQIVVACGEKTSYGYRRIAWWMQREKQLHVNGKRVLRVMKEEEVWVHEYRSIEEARASIGRWIEEYNHNRPHQSLQNRTPHEAFLAWEAIQLSEAPNVQF